MTNDLQQLFKSLGLVTLVSSGLGIVIGVLFGFKIGFAIFVLAAILQFVVGYFLSVYRDIQSNAAHEINQQVIQELSAKRLPFDLNCAYCNISNRVPISFTQDNVYKCVSCNQPNKVYIQFTSVRLTTPLTPAIDTSIVPMDDEDVNVSTTSQSTVNQSVTIA